MSKNSVDKLQKQNEELQTEIKKLQTELQKVKENVGSRTTSQEMEKSVEFLSHEYEDFKSNRSTVEQSLKEIETSLNNVILKANEIEDAVEAMLKYSYQYNLKLIGVPQDEQGETAEQTVDICLKLFKEMGIKISEFDIDIAHRTPNRQKSIPAPIVCKFTRRITKEAILKQKKQVNKIDLGKIGLTANADTNMVILEHLTPKQHDLLKKTKAFQQRNEYEFCWVKNQTILLRENGDSKIIRISTQGDLEQLNGIPSSFQPSWALPPHFIRGSPFPRSRGTSRGYSRGGDRGRASGPRTRSKSTQGN